MNKLIKQCEIQSGIDVYGLGLDRVKWESRLNTFSELLIQDILRLLRQQWYDLNNAVIQDESSRDIAIRVGRKTEILHMMSKIKQHYGIETAVDAMAGDGGYSLSTHEKQAEFAAQRNYKCE